MKRAGERLTSLLPRRPRSHKHTHRHTYTHRAYMTSLLAGGTIGSSSGKRQHIVEHKSNPTCTHALPAREGWCGQRAGSRDITRRVVNAPGICRHEAPGQRPCQRQSHAAGSRGRAAPAACCEPAAEAWRATCRGAGAGAGGLGERADGRAGARELGHTVAECPRHGGIVQYEHRRGEQPRPHPVARWRRRGSPSRIATGTNAVAEVQRWRRTWRRYRCC